jgi:hypothetical protein
MSDDVTCERCGLLGWRHRGHVAPEGWYFGSFTLEGDNHDPGDLLIVSACSEACRDALWTKMAGHRWNAIERRVDVPAELSHEDRGVFDRLNGAVDAYRDSRKP